MSVDVILFDLGNVLVDFSNEPIVLGLAERARRDSYQDPRQVARFLFDHVDGAENRFDKGEVSPEEFFREIALEMGLDLTYEGFVDIWNPIFRPRAGSEELVRFLHDRVEMHLLSNTNSLHFPYILAASPWLRLLNSWFLSHEMGCRKPSFEIYQMALARVSRPAERVLYVDDLEANLIPARKMGIRVAQLGKETPLADVVREAIPELPWAEFGGSR